MQLNALACLDVPCAYRLGSRYRSSTLGSPSFLASAAYLIRALPTVNPCASVQSPVPMRMQGVMAVS